MTKPTKWSVRPVKTQISLGIRPVWSVFTVRLMGSWRPMFLHVDSEDSDQTGRIWVVTGHTDQFIGFAGCTDHFVGFVMRWLNYVVGMILVNTPPYKACFVEKYGKCFLNYYQISSLSISLYQECFFLSHFLWKLSFLMHCHIFDVRKKKESDSLTASHNVHSEFCQEVSGKGHTQNLTQKFIYLSLVSSSLNLAFICIIPIPMYIFFPQPSLHSLKYWLKTFFPLHLSII